MNRHCGWVENAHVQASCCWRPAEEGRSFCRRHGEKFRELDGEHRAERRERARALLVEVGAN